MQSLSLPLVLVLAAVFLVGAVLGWMLRREKDTSRLARLADRRRQQLEEQQRKFERLHRQRKELRERLVEMRDHYRSRLLEAGNNDADSGNSEVERLRTELAASIERRDALRGQLDRLIARSRKVAAEAAEGRARIASLEQELESWQGRLPPLMARYRDKARQADELAARLAERDAVVTSDGPARLDTPAATGGDNLQRIRGIGPALERKLHALGIYRLEQIAGFGQDDIARVGAELGAFAGRIDRDGWVDQARAMIGK